MARKAKKKIFWDGNNQHLIEDFTGDRQSTYLQESGDLLIMNSDTKDVLILKLGEGVDEDGARVKDRVKARPRKAKKSSS